MSRIKYTIVPKENLEACIFESGVRLSEVDIIIDPIIVFNANMELGIETEIYGEEMNEDNLSDSGIQTREDDENNKANRDV